METLKPTTNRLLALDVMRGITIAGMILVNNPGSWGHIYTPLEHASWNGLTPTDLVFPFFMFIMGISMYFSLRKYNFEPSGSALYKIVKRFVLIMLIGWAITWFARVCRAVASPDMTFWDMALNFSDMRLLGVFPRLALCYLVTALLAITVKRRALIWITASILVLYAIVLLVGHGYEFSEQNVIAVVDRNVLGEAHMYTDAVDGVRMKFDPEGLLSTLPSIAHCIIGLLCGGMIVKIKDNEQRVLNLFIIGALLTFAGFLLSYGLPINKRVWSPTFVLTTCGLASTLLALLIWGIDIKGKSGWCKCFEVFGINPLFLFVVSDILAILLATIRVPFGAGETITIRNLWYQHCLVPLCTGNATLASLIYALVFVGVNWLTGLPLYKKKIYIKI